MSAITMAVAVIHDTVPADVPPEAVLVINEVSSPVTKALQGATR